MVVGSTVWAAHRARTQLNLVADMLGRQFPKVKTMLLDAATDITAFADFPPAHWKKIDEIVLAGVVPVEGGARALLGSSQGKPKSRHGMILS
jgi:hypothetical protein